jgi:hypothetical protein
MLVREVLSELVPELENGLREYQLPALALQVANLVIVDRCRCGDDFCATFYTAPKPSAAFDSQLETIELDCEQGYLNVDVLNGKIVCVEVLYRDAVRDKLLAALP